MDNLVFVVCCDADEEILKTGEPPTIIQELLQHTNQWSPDGYHGQGVVRYAIPWQIDNKYYTADVNLRVLDYKAWIALDTAAAQGEAFLFLASKAKLHTLEAVKAAVEVHGTTNVNLCVISSQDNQALVTEEELSSFEEFCISNGLEYVDTDVVDESVREFGHDRAAVHRVIDALSTHMWPVMQMKKQQQQKEKSGPTDRNPERLPTVNKPAQPSAENNVNLSNFFANIDDDDEDGLDRVIQAALNLRSQIGNMSDDQRRAAAAQVAMSFMQQLGEDDDEFDEP